MTIKEEIQIEEYKRTFAEAYKQGFIDAMNVCKTEPQIVKKYDTFCGVSMAEAIEVMQKYKASKDEPQTERSE